MRQMLTEEKRTLEMDIVIPLQCCYSSNWFGLVTVSLMFSWHREHDGLIFWTYIVSKIHFKERNTVGKIVFSFCLFFLSGTKVVNTPDNKFLYPKQEEIDTPYYVPKLPTGKKKLSQTKGSMTSVLYQIKKLWL